MNKYIKRIKDLLADSVDWCGDILSSYRSLFFLLLLGLVVYYMSFADRIPIIDLIMLVLGDLLLLAIFAFISYLVGLLLSRGILFLRGKFSTAELGGDNDSSRMVLVTIITVITLCIFVGWFVLSLLLQREYRVYACPSHSSIQCYQSLADIDVSCEGNSCSVNRMDIYALRQKTDFDDCTVMTKGKKYECHDMVTSEWWSIEVVSSKIIWNKHVHETFVYNVYDQIRKGNLWSYEESTGI